MAPYALHLSARYLHRASLCIFVKVDLSPPGRCMFPFYGSELGFLARGINQPGVHPTCPIAGITIPCITYIEVQFLDALDFSRHVKPLPGGLRGHHLACEKRLGSIFLRTKGCSFFRRFAIEFLQFCLNLLWRPASGGIILISLQITYRNFTRLQPPLGYVHLSNPSNGV